MNTQNTPQPKVTPDQIIGEVKTYAEPFRVQAMRVIAFLGLLISGIGSADITGIIALLPEGWAEYWLTIGLFAASSKQAVLSAGDFLDNWKMDNSFKLNSVMLPFLFILAGVVLISSCGISITEDGCILGSKKRGDSTYYVGPCVGPDTDQDGNADVDRFRVRWTNEDGQEVRGTYWLSNSHAPLLEYRLQDGLWVRIDSKSGVTLSPIPPPMASALEGDPQPADSTL